MILDKNVKIDIELSHQMVLLRMVSWHNTLLRDQCIWLGVTPLRPRGENSNIIAGLFCSLHVKDIKKPAKRNLDKISVEAGSLFARTIKEEVIPGKNNNNKSGPAPMDMPFVPPPRDNLNTSSFVVVANDKEEMPDAPIEVPDSPSYSPMEGIGPRKHGRDE